MKKRLLPYGVYDYEKLRDKNFLYIDKTEYIEKLEVIGEYILFTRPRRFGKSLFVSTLENYYDINKKDKFDKLFADTYIGKNPTDERNSYYILRFSFSGIDTENKDGVKKEFYKKVRKSLNTFLEYYNIDNVKIEDEDNPATLLSMFLGNVKYKIDSPIYLLIDEYDQFANELLGFNKDAFLNIIQENGFVRKFYEIIKEEVADSTIGRIFITGVTPIAMDGMTSGFNIAKLVTNRLNLNEMMGFTKAEVENIAKEFLDKDLYEKDKNKIFEEMKYYYDGYKFNKKAKEHIYNSDMCLYYLDNYNDMGESPENIVDSNAKSDYTKIEQLLTMGNQEENKMNMELLEEILTKNESSVQLVEKFEIGEHFDSASFASLLFYMGLLTMTGDTFGSEVSLKIPNETTKELYVKLFLKVMKDTYKFNVDSTKISRIFKQMAKKGKNDLYVKYIEEVLHAMSNRDFQGMREIDVKMIAFTVSMMARSIYDVKSEREVEDGYIDLAYLPRIDIDVDYYALIEFKYIKKSSATDKELENLTKEGENEIEKYIKEPQIAKLNESGKLKKWVLIFVKDKCVVNKEL